MDGDEGTFQVDSYVDRLQDAQLISPINGFHVVDDEDGQPVLQIDTPVPLGQDLVARVEAVLGSVPHRLRHVPLRDDGQRPGVSYGGE